MAYSNWGAFVFCNGERRTDCEDVPVFGSRDAELASSPDEAIFVNILRTRAQYGSDEAVPEWEHARHAVLGSGPVRLCGYKGYAELFVARSESEIVEIDITPFRRQQDIAADDWDWYWGDRNRSEDWPLGEGIAGELKGHRFEAEPDGEPERVDLRLLEPDGTLWLGQSGYCIGAGYEDTRESAKAMDELQERIQWEASRATT